MGKRNKHFHREKELQRLRDEDNLIFEAIRAQGWIKLDKPYHQGYTAKWVLRDDISRREDAKHFQHALDLCNKPVWSRNKDFRYKHPKTKKTQTLLPGLKSISKKKYESLPPQVKKLFREDHSLINWSFGVNRVTYSCILTYELVVSTSKTYVTHRREHDAILYQREAEIEAKLYNLTDGHPWGNFGDGKFWRRRALKAKHTVAECELREEVNDYLINGDYNEYYYDGGDWDDWMDY